jgi:hypothetical protein
MMHTVEQCTLEMVGGGGPALITYTQLTCRVSKEHNAKLSQIKTVKSAASATF